MKKPEPLPNEAERLAELFRYDILDTLPENDFDEIVELASQLCGAEISLISIVDDRRQWFKARHGIDAQETPKDIAFCTHAIHGNEIFEVHNAIEDERFFDNPLVTDDPNIRFYAGQPICSASGHKFGTLCVIDRHPRELTEAQRHILSVLGRQVERQLELRLKIRELEKSLKVIDEQNKAITYLNNLKDRTLSVLCHDLRSPLAGLEGILELFEINALNAEEMIGLLQEVQPDIEQCSQQLNNVLHWVRTQMEDGEVECYSFSLQRVGQKSLAWIEKDAQRKGVNLNSQIEDDLLVFGNEELLQVVWRNLLSNAVKYTRQGDEITLFAYKQADKQDEQVCLGVRDTGLGIKPENIEKILGSHLQLSTLGTAQEKGTGLGLLLCKTYLHKMNTELQANCQWAKGCEFFFFLPQGSVS